MIILTWPEPHLAKIFLLSNALPPTFSPSKDIPFLIQTLHRQLDGSSSGSVLDSIVLSVDGITYDEMDDQGRQEIPSVSWQGLLDVWQAVEALKKDGKVSRIGVSELNLGSLEKLSKSVEVGWITRDGAVNLFLCSLEAK